VLTKFRDLQKEWKELGDVDKAATEDVLSLLDKTRERFRKTFKLTRPGHRKTGYRDLSMVDKDREAKVSPN